MHVVDVLPLVAAVFVVHELGHYVAAGLAGVPAADRKLVWVAVPPHVALADGDEWVSPFENERFSDVYGRYDPENRHGEAFTAAGLLAQTVAAVAVAAAASVLAPDLGAAAVRVSLWFVVGLFAVDLVASAIRGAPFSDVTHLWRLDPVVAVGVVVGTVGTHVAALRWLL